MPEAFKKLFRNAKKVMNANKNKKLKEQSAVKTDGGKMGVEKDDDSVNIDELREVI